MDNNRISFNQLFIGNIMNSYNHGNLAALMAPSLVQLARLQARLAATSAPMVRFATEMQATIDIHHPIAVGNLVRFATEMQATIDANKAAMARFVAACAPMVRFAAEMQARLDADNVKWKLMTARLEADTRRVDAISANIRPLAAR